MKEKPSDELREIIRETVAEVLLDIIADPVQSPVREPEARKQLVQSLEKIRYKSQQTHPAEERPRMRQRQRNLSRWTP